MLEVREGGWGSPRIGALVGIGEPGATATEVLGATSGNELGALYMYVAASTMPAPSTKENVIG